MNGWTISDLGIDSHLIDNGGPLVIGPGEYKVFVHNAAAMAPRASRCSTSTPASPWATATTS